MKGHTDPTVAVIDDGVSALEFPDLVFDFAIGNGSHKRDLISLPFSHGTICAGIIRAYAPNAKIGSIQVLDENSHTGTVQSLAEALLWCAKNKISIAHMSIGSQEPRDYFPLFDAVHRALEARVAIVAANTNQQSVSAPAFFPGVIGVRADPLLENCAYYKASLPNQGINYYASSRHALRFSGGKVYSTSIGNSFAAPVITSALCTRAHSFLMEVDLSTQTPEYLNCWTPNELAYYQRADSYADIPIICFYDENATFFAPALSKYFMQNGYFPLLVSEHSIDARYGFQTARKGLAADAGLKCAAAMGADLLMLAGTSKNTFFYSQVEPDIVVVSTESMSAQKEYPSGVILCTPENHGENMAFCEKVIHLLTC